jgi:hypothetical protein
VHAHSLFTICLSYSRPICIFPCFFVVSIAASDGAGSDRCRIAAQSASPCGLALTRVSRALRSPPSPPQHHLVGLLLQPSRCSRQHTSTVMGNTPTTMSESFVHRSLHAMGGPFIFANATLFSGTQAALQAASADSTPDEGRRR